MFESSERLVPDEYGPSHLLDSLVEKLALRNDASLAKMLAVGASTLSRIRNNRIAVSAATLIRMHEICGLEISELRRLMGDRRDKFRIGDQGWRQS